MTNLGGATQIVHAHVRAITRTLSNHSGTVTLNSSSPTFVDQFGVARPYEQVTFTVPSGTDRLDSFEAWTGPQARVDETLIDPSGWTGRTVRGTLYVDVFSSTLDLGGELVALPYEYTVS